MDFDDTREEAAFRTEARQWLAAHAEPKRGAFETWQSRYPGREGWDGLERAKAFQSQKGRPASRRSTGPRSGAVGRCRRSTR